MHLARPRFTEQRVQGLILAAKLRRNFYIQLPPANNGRSPSAVGEPTSVLIPLIERARWETLLGLGEANGELFCFINMLRAADSR